jgi:hypothetical protein
VEKNKGRRVDSRETGGFFGKTTNRRGISHPRTLDLGSTAEIKNGGCLTRGAHGLAARAGHGCLMHGAHRPAARVGRWTCDETLGCVTVNRWVHGRAGTAGR